MGALVLVAATVLGAVVLREGDPSVRSGGESRTVETRTGLVRGVDDDGVRHWRGVPYARPPVGALRWQPPQPMPAWDGVRAADAYGAPCLQPTVDYAFGSSGLQPRPGSSEDCLYLNVARPIAPADDGPLPVVVWLHGGGFFAGSGATADAAADAFVRRGVVLVSINYRLGLLGFFAHPALPGGVANYGLLDQIAALRWVRDNAAAFGGDPARVTLVGGSAGAMSVNALMAAPRAAGLFDAAIAQSAPSDHNAVALAQARRAGERRFPGLGAGALRALPADRLLDSRFNVLSGSAPILDDVLPRPSVEAFARGEETAVPYVLGSTATEFDDADFRSFDTDPDALRAALGGPQHRRLVAAYGSRYAEEVLDDALFRLPALRLARWHARRAPTYRFVFAAERGASRHGSEVGFLFDDTGERDPSLAEYWVAFARTGRPEVAGLPAWPRADDDGLLVFTPRGPRAETPDPALGRLRVLDVVTR
ncbi:carboxylesterase/lipase family protein [Nocardioides sp.]|uniref:carboxylesterase/lipase family protein n=1 Tax=Nocardioides sp. TaxID=35761 RepID=UPI0035113789